MNTPLIRPLAARLLAAGLLLAALAPRPLAGQEPARDRAAETLPDEVANAAVDFFNDPRRERFFGPARIDSGSVFEGDVAVLEGPLTIAGRVEGSLVVVNGDVVLQPGAAVTGDVLVVGGAVHGIEAAELRGQIIVYRGRLAYRRDGDRIVRTRPPEPDGDAPERSESSWDSDVLVTVGESYNRVEGLPVTFGPRLWTRGEAPLRAEALAVYRTESGFRIDPETFGYFVRVQQFFGGGEAFRVGLGVHSLISPIEASHISDLENGLATFLFHEDFRDHYEREGATALFGWSPATWPIALTGEVLWEHHASVPAGSPLTLVRNAEPWRLQPLIAEGRLGSVRAAAVLDTRSDPWDPAAGWLIRGSVEQAFHSTLATPEASPSEADCVVCIDPPPPELYGRFGVAAVDVRRYNRLSPDARLNFRLYAGGSLMAGPLPPQRQFALGGEGSLPGYDLLSRDCGVRRSGSVVRARDGSEFFGGYGCDLVALVQAEARGKLDVRLRLDSAPWDEDEHGPGFGLDVAPDWVAFVDAGRGWGRRGRADAPTAVDVGAGLVVHQLGLYFAAPLSGGDGVNVFVRLGPRF